MDLDQQLLQLWKQIFAQLIHKEEMPEIKVSDNSGGVCYRIISKLNESHRTRWVPSLNRAVQLWNEGEPKYED